MKNRRKIIILLLAALTIGIVSIAFYSSIDHVNLAINKYERIKRQYGVSDDMIKSSFYSPGNDKYFYILKGLGIKHVPDILLKIKNGYSPQAPLHSAVESITGIHRSNSDFAANNGLLNLIKERIINAPEIVSRAALELEESGDNELKGSTILELSSAGVFAIPYIYELESPGKEKLLGITARWYGKNFVRYKKNQIKSVIKKIKAI